MVYTRLNTVILFCIFDNVFTFFSSNKQILRRNFGFQRSLRVYDGEIDVGDEYPYVVALGFISPAEEAKRIFGISSDGDSPLFVRTCSGSLITPRWVLSAQHCVGHQDAGPTVIAYGNTTLPPKEKTYFYSKISKRISHQTKDVDVGLLLLEESDKVTISSYGRLSAVDYKTLAGLAVKYVGYGITEFPPSIAEVVTLALKTQTKNRMVGEALVVPCESYDTTLRKKGVFVFFKPDMCIVSKCSRRQSVALAGDSGGPLLQNGRIVAVAKAWLPELQPSNTFTPLSPYVGWITRVMSSNTNSG